MTLPHPPRSSASLEGYWFDCLDPSIALDRSGNEVRLPKAAPPWLVVDQSIASITIGSRWPGQLWRVRVQTLGDMSGLVAQPGYWRAQAIELLEAIPLSTLFGPQGEAVMDIITRVDTLTRVEAQALEANLHPSAWTAYSRAWMRWSTARGETRQMEEEEWRGTLAASTGSDKQHSPIQSGFLLIHSLLRQRADAIDGDNAFTRIEEDGEIEIVLKPLWRNACDAILFAAMARGAPQCVSPDDAAVLTRAWGRVFKS
ncbi:hypothetical protein [Achromobacter pestifer]|uniref:Uncharacterized protein n=1 Tax=Achromobacter pestifer TaxID=1353889 RepID=A0A6S6ZXR0_9BURK|nr:hypothetical protein [Achromobacter pestifer]CAB3642980.1 hypothetical protein LMG3431_02281 [Achromobacter pestifer]